MPRDVVQNKLNEGGKAKKNTKKVKKIKNKINNNKSHTVVTKLNIPLLAANFQQKKIIINARVDALSNFIQTN